MKLGISLDAYLKTTSAEEGVRRLAAIGFDAVDVNLSDYCQPDSPLARDDWTRWIEDIGRVARESGIGLCQAHAPIYFYSLDEAAVRFRDVLTERTLEACGRLGIPWAVFHARTPSEGCHESNFEEVRAFNVEWLAGWADRAATHGVSVAVENMFRFDEGRFATYITTPDELIDLIDRIGRPSVAACLDTGHAFRSGFEPAEFARALGDRLRVLHVHDNLGTDDQHVAPFAGKIDWAAFMESLGEVGYEGVFSLEVHSQVQNMPAGLIDRAVSLVHDIGRHLVT